MRCVKRLARAFALYEVLLGLAIFSIGVLVLGRSVQNCLSASILRADQDRVTQILSNRMAEIQAKVGVPDEAKQTKVDTGYGEVTLIQRTVPAGLKDKNDLELSEIKRVTLTAEWTRGGRVQTKKIVFYVYRLG